MQIRISVVIPTYKRPKLLIKCLNALAEQSLDHKDFEIIVVSDGPDSKTGDALDRWCNENKLNLVYLQNTEQKGPAAARNKGWLNARAECVAFTDDDCIPDRNWLQAHVENCESEKDCAFTGKTIVPVYGTPSDFALNTTHLQEAEFITANCACSKRLLKVLGGFDERFKMAWREDSDLHFRLMRSGISILKLSDAVVVHPVRAAPWGISIKEQKKGLYDALLFKKHPWLYRTKVQPHPLWNYYFTLLLWLLFIISLWKNHNAGTILSALVLSLVIGFFFYKRIRATKKSASHLAEMLVTTIFIPFLSVYWRVYGSIKFRVFFI